MGKTKIKIIETTTYDMEVVTTHTYDNPIEIAKTHIGEHGDFSWESKFFVPANGERSGVSKCDFNYHKLAKFTHNFLFEEIGNGIYRTLRISHINENASPKLETLCQIVYCTTSFVGRTQLMCRAIAFHLLKNKYSLIWKTLSFTEDDIPFLEKVANGELNVAGLQNSCFIEIGFRKDSNYVKPTKKNCGEIIL